MNATLTQVEDGGDVLSLALLTVVGVAGPAVVVWRCATVVGAFR
jgi:hypothetical protein